MKLPRDVRGVAFGTRKDGDGRADRDLRVAISREVGIQPQWATLTQVHGARAVFVTEPGHHGEADALVSDVPGLPMVIATADCVPVVLLGQRTRAVIHAGWRGVGSGVVAAAISMMVRSGDEIERAIVGPHIGPCCYEVGVDVVEAIGGHVRTTRTGAMSVDLQAAVAHQLGDVPLTGSSTCTYDNDDLASYREDGTSDRQMTIVWVPKN